MVNHTIFHHHMTVTRPLHPDPLPPRPSAQAKLAASRPQAEGTLCPKLGRAAARAEGQTPNLAPLARAEGRGCTLCPSKLALWPAADPPSAPPSAGDPLFQAPRRGYRIDAARRECHWSSHLERDQVPPELCNSIVPTLLVSRWRGIAYLTRASGNWFFLEQELYWLPAALEETTIAETKCSYCSPYCISHFPLRLCS